LVEEVDLAEQWLLVLEPDGLRSMNGTAGPDAGDEMRRLVARRLREAVDQADEVFRLGADELAVLCVRDAETGAPTDLGERLVGAMAMPFVVNGATHYLGCNVGIARAVAGVGAEAVLRDAHDAVFAARSAGRDRWEVFDDELRADQERVRLLLVELRRAIENEEFELAFQPVVRLDTGAVVGAEALVRWRHPTRGLLHPGEFIVAAESSGAIVPLGLLVLRQALATLRDWIDRREVDPGLFTMSVNVSTVQLEEPGFVETVAVELARAGVDATSLVLEITETSLLSTAEGVISRLAGLRELGLQLAMDDFGTGHAGFGYLQRDLFDIVKLDRSLIADRESRRLWALVEAILTLADSFAFEVVAEGIEREEQATRLGSLGCAKAQGFYYARPVPADAFLAFLDEMRLAA
jgi:diguanylate cyclase (GGDEF)-like protein